MMEYLLICYANLYLGNQNQGCFDDLMSSTFQFSNERNLDSFQPKFRLCEPHIFHGDGPIGVLTVR